MQHALYSSKLSSLKFSCITDKCNTFNLPKGCELKRI